MNAAKRPEAESQRGFPVAVRDGEESGAEVLAVERATPDRHGHPRRRELAQQDADLWQGVEQQEDLDEDRRAADHLDVHGGELAHDRDSVGARGAERYPDRIRADNRDRRDLDRVDEAVPELVAVVGDEPPEVVGREQHCVSGPLTAAQAGGGPRPPPERTI